MSDLQLKLTPIGLEVQRARETIVPFTTTISEERMNWVLEQFPERSHEIIRDLFLDFPLEPLGDYIMVKPLDSQEKMVNGIVLPETSKEVTIQGIVVAAGPGWTDGSGGFHPMSLNLGDHVIFNQHAGALMTFGGVEFYYMTSRDINLRVRGNAPRKEWI